MGKGTIDFVPIQGIGCLLLILDKMFTHEIFFYISFVCFLIASVLNTCWIIRNRKRYREMDKPHRKAFILSYISMVFSILAVLLFIGDFVSS